MVQSGTPSSSGTAASPSMSTKGSPPGPPGPPGPRGPPPAYQTPNKGPGNAPGSGSKQPPNVAGSGVKPAAPISTITLTKAELLTMLNNAAKAAVANQPPPLAPKTKQLKAPRLGGVDETGVWVGTGSKRDPTVPRSSNCYRQVASTDVIKAANFINPIIKECRQGLAGHHSGLLFADTGEPNADQFVPTLRLFKEFCEDHGLEGSFIIHTIDGRKINMFETPGLVNLPLLEAHVKDLTKDGVWDHSDRDQAAQETSSLL